MMNKVVYNKCPYATHMKGEGRRSVYKRKAPGRQSGGSTKGIPIKTYARGQDRYSKLRYFTNELDFD